MSSFRNLFAALLVSTLCLSMGSESSAQDRNSAMRKAMQRQQQQRKDQEMAKNGEQGSDTKGSATKGSGTRGSSTNTSTSTRGGRRPMRPGAASNSGANVFDTNKLIAYFDGDGDGQLSLDEIDAASRLLYALDANADDRLTSDEMEEFAGAGQGSASRGDGSSTRGSGSTARSSNSNNRSTASSRSKRKSKNKNNNSDDRFAGRLGPLAGMGGFSKSDDNKGSNDKADFNATDKNNDGVLTRNELSARLRAKFSTMDSNGDREVDVDEFDDYMSDPAKNRGVVK